MVAVIGDIHGCYNTLKELLRLVKNKYNGIEIYSVGDLIDRGKFSFDVVELIKNENITFTPGNHDYMFYFFIKEPLHPMARSWIYNGSESTLASYENRLDKIDEHLELIINAPLFINHKDCFISHAGVSSYFKNKLPKPPLSDFQKFEDVIHKNAVDGHGIMWNRDSLLDLGKLQIVGHTRRREILHQKSNNTVYIDTSVYAANKLSAVVADNNHIADIISVPTFAEDLDKN